jgi:predicted nucleic acid-binding protein
VTAFVLDNSVRMRWCFDSGNHEYADEILRKLVSGGDEAVVPVLWRYEVSAVLVRSQLRGLIAPREVAEFLEDLEALPITVDFNSGGRVLTDVHHLAVHQRLTSYDAAYLELALRLALPLATLDDELLAACKRAGMTTL